MSKSGNSWNSVPLPAPNTKGGKRGMLKAPGLDQEEDKLFSYSVQHSNPTNMLVNSHSEHSRCWNKPRATLDSLDSPRPGLGGSHHLPPYSILYVTSPHPHSIDFLSRDSQSGVPKLSRFGLPGLWVFITSSSNL